MVDVARHSGLLTSCSVYLKYHYVVLNRGEGNFGLQSSAVLLDPVNISGTNIFLEIYDRNDQPVINPVVSVEVYHSPTLDIAQKEALKDKSEKLYVNLKQVYSNRTAIQRPISLASDQPREFPSAGVALKRPIKVC